MLFSVLMFVPWLVVTFGFLGTMVTGIVYVIYSLRERTNLKPEETNSHVLETEFRVPIEIGATSYEKTDRQGSFLTHTRSRPLNRGLSGPQLVRRSPD